LVKSSTYNFTEPTMLAHTIGCI